MPDFGHMIATIAVRHVISLEHVLLLLILKALLSDPPNPGTAGIRSHDGDALTTKMSACRPPLFHGRKQPQDWKPKI